MTLQNNPNGRSEAPVKTPTDARQGVTGHNVRYVLALGTAGVVIAFAVLYFVAFA